MENTKSKEDDDGTLPTGPEEEGVTGTAGASSVLPAGEKNQMMFERRETNKEEASSSLSVLDWSAALLLQQLSSLAFDDQEETVTEKQTDAAFDDVPLEEGENDAAEDDQNVIEVSTLPTKETWEGDVVEKQKDHHSQTEKSLLTLSKTAEKPAKKKKENSCSAAWADFVLQKFHAPIRKALHAISQPAARNPFRTLIGLSGLSMTLMAVGFATNFRLEYDEYRLWTPQESLSMTHMRWVGDVFPNYHVEDFFVFHEDGESVLGKAQMQRMFEFLTVITSLPGYDAVCSQSDHVSRYSNERTCEINGVTQFWNNSAEVFEVLSAEETDEQIVYRLSQPIFPDGIPVSQNETFGNAWRLDNGLLGGATAFNTYFLIPDVDGRDDLETEIIDATLDLRKRWKDDNQGFQFRGEVIVTRSFSDEFQRAIVNDLYLVPIVFILMSSFTAFFFARRHPIFSRSLLGSFAVGTIVFSIMCGYGLVFTIGVPFTSLSQLIPFVIFGIGLDDSFIIMGSYYRFDHIKDTLERIHHTIDEVGVSITLTTLTSALAFALGCISDIPAVRYLCLYAFPTVIIDFIFQVTFFVACIVLDERRIQERRRDICICIVVDDKKQKNDSDALGDNEEEVNDEDEINDEGSMGEAELEDKRQALYEGWMRAYGERLLNPRVKVLVILVFAAFAGICAWRASLLTQEFKFTEVVPRDSYITDLMEAMHDYAGLSLFWPFAYFRNVNQSDSSVQIQMINFVDELAAMKSISRRPERFWLPDLYAFSNATGISELPFETQVDAFLGNPVFSELYGDSIVRDDTGFIVASRVQLSMNEVDENDIHEQIDALHEQRDVSARQPINQGKEDLSFFTFMEMYNMWEFYAVAVDELILTCTIAVSVMTGVALIFVPHWSGALFVLPMISLVFVDLLGVLQLAGIHINAVSYVVLVISVGLMVDFVLHMIIRYYEEFGTRYMKTLRTMETMGISILVGGLTTFLGTLALALSTSSTIFTVFVGFCGLVSLGLTHSLILLPVVLSTIGPEDDVVARRKSSLIALADGAASATLSFKGLDDDADPSGEAIIEQDEDLQDEPVSSDLRKPAEDGDTEMVGEAQNSSDMHPSAEKHEDLEINGDARDESDNKEASGAAGLQLNLP